MGDGTPVEGFSLAQARVVVQEGSLLRDNWGVVRGVGATLTGDGKRAEGFSLAQARVACKRVPF